MRKQAKIKKILKKVTITIYRVSYRHKNSWKMYKNSRILVTAKLNSGKIPREIGKNP